MSAKSGWVYCLVTNGYAKVGFTSQGDWRARVSALQTGCPTEIVPAAAVRGSSDLEQSLHQELLGSRATGGREWFALTARSRRLLRERFGRGVRGPGWRWLEASADVQAVSRLDGEVTKACRQILEQLEAAE